MKRSTTVILVLVALLAAGLGVANRAPVAFSLDPFSDTHPALAVDMPLFLLLFLTLLLGILIGAATVALSRRGPKVSRTAAPEAKEAETRALAVMAAEKTGTE